MKKKKKKRNRKGGRHKKKLEEISVFQGEDMVNAHTMLSLMPTLTDGRQEDSLSKERELYRKGWEDMTTVQQHYVTKELRNIQKNREKFAIEFPEDSVTPHMKELVLTQSPGAHDTSAHTSVEAVRTASHFGEWWLSLMRNRGRLSVPKLSPVQRDVLIKETTWRRLDILLKRFFTPEGIVKPRWVRKELDNWMNVFTDNFGNVPVGKKTYKKHVYLTISLDKGGRMFAILKIGIDEESLLVGPVTVTPCICDCNAENVTI